MEVFIIVILLLFFSGLIRISRLLNDILVELRGIRQLTHDGRSRQRTMSNLVKNSPAVTPHTERPKHQGPRHPNQPDAQVPRQGRALKFTRKGGEYARNPEGD